MKTTFFMKLIPPRSTFATDMTASEKAIMEEHIYYWKVLIQKGICITFGPVLDPACVYGIAIIQLDDESKLAEIEANDPSVKFGINRFESFPMIATFA